MKLPFFTLTDEQAMWRVQASDDTEAFASLMNRWEQPICRLCFRMLGDVHKAEDVTQEAFVRIYAKRKEYQQGGKFSTFLWRITVNLCLDELRRVKRRNEFSSHAQPTGYDSFWEDIPSTEPTPAAASVSGERAHLVQVALDKLPDHYKSVVILRHYQDLKFREIADVLAIPEGTVKSRMAEALALLHEALRPHFSLPCSAVPRRTPNQKEALVL